jgi:PPOX class probable F420-dependent enzyme
MSAIPASAHELINSDSLGHLVTLNPDGSPQTTCVWVGLAEGDEGDENEIVFSSLDERQKLRNIRRDPRVSLSIEAKTPPNEWGLVPYLVIRGTARITEGGGPALLNRLAQTYLGPGSTFPPMDDPPEGFIVHITADKISGVGPWA